MANDHNQYPNRRNRQCQQTSSSIESESASDYCDSDEITIVHTPMMPMMQCAPCGPFPQANHPPICPKDPCPLQSFCDYGLRQPCHRAPYVDPYLPKREVTTWTINYLVSNTPAEAAHLDEFLMHPRGIVIYNNQLWVANLMSDKITNYDLFGNQMLGPIQIRWNRGTVSFPSGLAVNCGSGFAIAGIGALGTNAATLMTPTKTGDLVAYNPLVAPRRGIAVLNSKITGTVSDYTGIAIVGETVYLANFFQGYVDVFNGEYSRIGVPGRMFVDNFSSDPIPGGYAPFNVNYIPPYLYVAYAEREPGLFVHNNHGLGKGFVSVFGLDGGFIRRFHSRGVLNAPWSVIPAPNECGIPPGSVLVNNIGDGFIHIFDCNGNLVGPMLGQSGIPLVITGIQSMAPYYTTFSQIFFTSSGDIESKGIVGSLVKSQVITI